MAYTQGFLTAAANPRQSIYELLKPFLLANGFTVIKDYGFVNGSTQGCALRHTASGTALVIGYTNNTYICIQPCEDFNPATDTMIGPMYSNNTGRAYGANGVTPDVVYVPTTYTTWWAYMTPTSNSLYQFVAYGDAYAIMIDNMWIVLDSYTPLSEAADAPPNFSGWSITSGNLYQVGSRVHNATVGGTTSAWVLNSTSIFAVFGEIAAVDPYTGAKPLLRIPRFPLHPANFAAGVATNSISSKPTGIYSTLRGASVGSVPTLGDTVTDGGTVYAIISGGSTGAQLLLRRE